MCECTYLNLVHAAERVMAFRAAERDSDAYRTALTLLHAAIQDAKDDLFPSVFGGSCG